MTKCKKCGCEFKIPDTMIILVRAYLCEPCFIAALKKDLKTKKSPDQIINDQLNLF